MEEGSMRADVNVSVRRPGEPFGTRCEIKNVNSIRFVQQAIIYESQRQVEVIEEGGTIVQETRLFDPGLGETRSMRSKEEAHDYRYFPDPDLLPLVVEQSWVDEIRASLPELPDDKKARFMSEYGLSAYDAGVLVGEQVTADYYETVAKDSDPKMAANWITGELFGFLNKSGQTIDESPITSDRLGELLSLIKDGTISGRIAKEVFEAMTETGKGAKDIVEEKGLKQVSDSGALEKIIDEVLAGSPQQLEQYRAGKDKLFGYFVGQTMKATKGQANPQVVNELLKKKLEG
jgi:aspartyl-tRNA(Asn)/glutamyl-tRNA(Gln) amidotransferase subunit B